MPIIFCFWLSGAAALVLQVVWTRMLGHVFGATSLAISTTLGVFMVGLALGSALAGRYASRTKAPFVWFAGLEALVGLYGLAVPHLLGLLPSVQARFALDLGFGGYTTFRLAMVFVVLIVPTTAMGASLPLLAEGIVRSSSHMASRTGRLYAANTLGAVIGTVLAGFLLIPGLGMTATVHLAAAADLLVALIVILVLRFGGRDALIGRLSELARRPDDVLAELDPSVFRPIAVTRGTQTLVLVAFAASGATAMALEVLWTRAVGVVIGASTYAFTLILTTFLVGLAGGAAMVSRVVDRLRDPVHWLAVANVSAGGLALLAALLIDRLPLLLHLSTRSLSTTATTLYLTNFVITSLVILPSTLALGAIFPLVIRICGVETIDHAGQVVGRAYSVNTIGAIVGSLAGGFLVLPLLGVQRGIVAASILLAVLGAALALGRVLAILGRPWPMHEGVTKAVAWWPIGGALAVLVVASIAPAWDIGRWTSGLFRVHVARTFHPETFRPTSRVIYHRDGIATTVTVDEEAEGGGVSLKVNGKVDASDEGDMPTQIMSGLLPILAHPDPKDVLVIGYGSGVTSGAVLTAPIETLTVAEIEARVYEAANRHFAHVNHRPADDERATLVVDDGRNFLLTRPRTYDVIISEPSNPWMTGAASLFTREFFEIARRRLRAGGVFLQWLQLYELSADNVAALLRTFQHVFPHVLVFTSEPQSNDTLLLGSVDPLLIRLDRIRELRQREPALADELTRAGLQSEHDLLPLFLLGGDELASRIGPGPLNTDDNARIEFQAPRDLLTYAAGDPDLPFLGAIEGRRLEWGPRYFQGLDVEGPDLVVLAARHLAFGRWQDAAVFLDEAERRGFESEPWSRILDYLTEEEREPVVIVNTRTTQDRRYARVVLTLSEGRHQEALRLFDAEKDLAAEGLEYALLGAYLRYRNDQPEGANAWVQRVLDDPSFVAEHPAALYYGARIAVLRADFEYAVALLQRYDDLFGPPETPPKTPEAHRAGP